MPFQPTYMSWRKRVAEVIHTSANDSLLPWIPWQSVSPVSGQLLDVSQWVFSVADEGGMHVGKITLLPGVSQDIELRSLAFARDQITIQVMFSNGLKGDLVVNLGP
jgi:hypothetical protein